MALVLVPDADCYGGGLAKARFEGAQGCAFAAVFVCCAAGAGDGAYTTSEERDAGSW